MKKTVLSIVIGIAALSLLGGGQVRGEVKEYKVPGIADFSGPYAELFKAWVPVQKAVFAWWNDTVGKDLGLKLKLKHYDGRYDSSVIASMWPGILAECKPIIGIGGGGASVAALQQRLPKDQVPLIYGTASYGFAWLPNQWLFQVRPTYTHEMVAALRWYIEKHPEKRPVRFAFISSQIAPALDNVKGMEKYIQEVLEPKELCKVVDKEFVDLNPVDVSSQMKKIIDAKADLVSGPCTSASVAAYIRACQLHGVNIPTLMSPHHTIWPFGKAMGTYEPMEGHLVVAAHVSIKEKDGPAYKFYKLLQDRYELKKGDWDPFQMMGFSQSILAVRAVEHAAKRVGVANISGQAVYDAILAEPFTHEELMGVLPTLIFTKEAPFCTRDLKVMIETVKNGKYVLATPEWIPVPDDVTKW